MKSYGKLAARPDADIYSFNASKSAAAAEIVASTVQKSLNPFSDYSLDAPILPPSTASGGGRPMTAARPMTSAKGAGYSSAVNNQTKGAFDPLGLGQAAPAPPLLTRQNLTPESQCRELEKAIHQCIEQASFHHRGNQNTQGLEKAKDAAKKERALTKLREKYSLVDSANHDLTYSVLLTLADSYARCQLYEESLNTYSIIVKNRAYPASGRLRVNMGNLHFVQGNYLQAIKLYRMCMDTLPPAQRDLKSRIQRNIAVCFLKMGQFQDAIHTFEAIMDAPAASPSNGQPVGPSMTSTGSGDVQSGFDLIVCYYALGDREKMKKGFLSLLVTPELLALNEHEDSNIEDIENQQSLIEQVESDVAAINQSVSGEQPSTLLPVITMNDSLSADRRARRRHLQKYLLTAARLIAHHIEAIPANGYDWIIDQLRKPKSNNPTVHQALNRSLDPSTGMFDELAASKPGFPVTAMHLLLAKGIAYIHANDLSSAIQVFRTFHHTYAMNLNGNNQSVTDQSQQSNPNNQSINQLIDHAAVNLSFLYFLERDYVKAGEYADLAVKHDRYNAKALVNKANVLFACSDLEGAKEVYLESIGVEADCCEAIYNLGLVNCALQSLPDSCAAFNKLHKLAPYDKQVMWHLGRAHEQQGQYEEAIHLYHTLHSASPQDPALLAKLGSLYAATGDETAAFHCYSDSHALFPLSMPVLSWLGVWYVKMEMFDEAITYFEQADLLEPQAPAKWKLMIASCHRRLGDRQKASKLYQAILIIDHENVEALKYLAAIAQDTGITQEYEKWMNRLHRLEKGGAKQQQNGTSQANNQTTNQPTNQASHDEQDSDIHPPVSSPHLSPRRSSVKQTNNQPINQSNSSPKNNQPNASISISNPAPVAPDTSFKHDLGPEQVRKTVNSGVNNTEDEWGDDALADDLLPL